MLRYVDGEECLDARPSLLTTLVVATGGVLAPGGLPRLPVPEHPPLVGGPGVSRRLTLSGLALLGLALAGLALLGIPLLGLAGRLRALLRSPLRSCWGLLGRLLGVGLRGRL